MKHLLVLSFALFTLTLSAQDKVKLYNPKADARAEIDAAIVQAKEEGKHVFLQVGGNWCPWCIKLHNYCDTVASIDSILTADYVVLRVNYSRENKNETVLASLDYPQRFGFPVLVILDADGKRLHTQDSAFLESDGFYSKEKVERFLLTWNPKAVDPNTYQKK